MMDLYADKVYMMIRSIVDKVYKQIKSIGR